MESTIAILLTLLGLITPTLGTDAINTAAISNKLNLDFYKTTCPNVQKIVEDTVKKHATQKPGIIPGLIRLHFHDCYISGCDASILLKPERYNSFNSEMAHPANGNSLRGMDALEEAKAMIEKQCPNVVSCADILAYATRDAIVLAGNPRYEVPAGRRDSFNTDGGEANNLPKGNASVPDLEKGYAARGLTVEDLVVLEAAHSIGQSRCLITIADPESMTNQTVAEKGMDKAFQKAIKGKYCPESKVDSFWNMTLPLNPEKPDNSAWGTSFFDYSLKGQCLLPCDIAISVDSSTKPFVEQFAKDKLAWQKKFNEAMIKVSKINVLTGDQGEIRKTCGWINGVNIM